MAGITKHVPYMFQSLNPFPNLSMFGPDARGAPGLSCTAERLGPAFVALGL